MGRVKHIEAELDNGWDVRVFATGATIMLTLENIELTSNDLEQMLNVVHYLRNVAPFEHVDTKITAEFPVLETK